MTGSSTLIDVAVETITEQAENVISLALKRVDGLPFDSWDAGSHIDVHLQDGLVRQYSLCSSPDNHDALSISVLKEPHSRGGSQYVHESLKVGSKIRVSLPRNNFPLITSRKYLFIAGGIGITPILPMMEKAEHEGREWRLVYLGKSKRTMAFADDLLARYGADKVSIFASEDSGRFDLAGLLALPRAHMLIYACGPAHLLNDIEGYSMGWPPGVLHIERFSSEGLTVGGSSEPFELELKKSNKVVSVTAEETVLDALENVGVRVLSSCKAGLCGTCETRVLAGEIDHRDAVLTLSDRDAGDVMMVCVSRAAAGCSRITLDI